VLLNLWFGPTFLTMRAAKRGRKDLDPRLAGFVATFKERYGFAPLWIDLGSITWDAVMSDRLIIALERTSQLETFVREDPSFDPIQERAVIELFDRECTGILMPGGPLGLLRHVLDAKSLFVVFDQFESRAVEKAHGSICGRRLRAFEQQLGLGDRFWCTASGAWPPVIFVYTDDQAAAVRASGIQRSWADLWYAMVKPFDEFGYISREDIEIVVDSKQNFDENYESNWRYYST